MGHALFYDQLQKNKENSTSDKYPQMPKCLISQTSKMQRFPKIVNGFKPLNIFAKSFILDVCLSSKCASNTAQKLKFSITDFFSKYDQIRRKLRICSHLLKKSVLENFIFCAVCLQLMGKYSTRPQISNSATQTFHLKQTQKPKSIQPTQVSLVSVKKNFFNYRKLPLYFKKGPP